jgi:hypothetical protein
MGRGRTKEIDILITKETSMIAAVSTAPERRRGHRFSFRGPLLLRRTGEREAFLLTVICALDMYTTLYWVLMGYAKEGNARLAWTFNHHPIWFVVVKCASCLPALFLAPHLAQRRPQFTVWLLRATIVAYVLYYSINIR